MKILSNEPFQRTTLFQHPDGTELVTGNRWSISQLDSELKRRLIYRIYVPSADKHELLARNQSSEKQANKPL